MFKGVVISLQDVFKSLNKFFRTHLIQKVTVAILLDTHIYFYNTLFQIVFYKIANTTFFIKKCPMKLVYDALFRNNTTKLVCWT